MNKLIRKTTGTVLGLTLALVSGTPALADDTELLLLSPTDPSQLKPNVMFILDTSGSMTTVQTTGQPYNATSDYSAFGTCDRDKLYYNDGSSTPVCDPGNTMYIDKDSFHCADSVIQMTDVGAYTGILAQYRSGASGVAEWLELEPGNSSDEVECASDSALHGENGAADPTAVYAAAGTGLSYPWTSDPAQEVDWTSSGRSTTYKIHDGNYLNYKNDPATQDLSRSDIMKEVTKTVLNSVNDMNVGIMRFNGEQGGVVIQPPIDLDSNRAAILARIDGLNADGYTPLSETLLESALFWEGQNAYYATLDPLNRTAADALVSTDPMTYKQPDLLSCSKNFNVLLSDGIPRRDVETPSLLGRLPNYASVLGRTDCTGNATPDPEYGGECLDDIGEYLANTDIHATMAGRQSVITHTIGFTMDIPVLEDTARVSGGQYLRADDTDQLLVALTDIVSQVNERALSFTAPAVSVNTFNRTRNLNDLYMTTFAARGNAHWPGNLKAYRIEDGKIVDALGADAVDPSTGFFYPTARSFWTAGQADGNDVLLGGAANELPDPSTRRLFTDNGTTSNLSDISNAISIGNNGAYSDSDFGLTGGGTTKDDIINWMRGVDVKDEDGDPATTVRYAMGDPLHSRPAVVVYGGTPASPQSVIYTATNDGYLHAVDASDGTELWSYVPKELLPGMARLYDDPEITYKLYGIDGDVVPVTRDVDNDGVIEAGDGDFALILFGMRRGGSTYRMLNVTDKNNPVLVWERVLDDGGQSWSTPVVTRMDIFGSGQNALKAVVVLGGGYDGVHDTPAFNAARDNVGAGVHVLDLLSGATLWEAGHTDSSTADLKLAKMTRAIPTRIKVIDINGDGFADRMYAADLGGQLWRFDISNGNAAATAVAGGVIAQLGAEGLSSPGAGDTRRFYNSPDVAMFSDAKQNRRFMSVSIGSGYRAHPLNTSANDRFYSIRDPNVFNSLTQTEYNALTPIVEDDLEDITGRVNVTVAADDDGWMFRLPANQMILADSVTFNDEVFFVSFSPDSTGAAACNVGQGSNYLWRVSIINGDPIVDDLGSIPTDGEDDARNKQLAQGGIAPSPQFLFPSPDDANCTGADCAPPPLGCIGVECFDPGFTNNPVRTLWTQDGIE
jgi:type IV pilus assembly protein PilY1